MGTASGGVLKSYDRGATWANIFDDNSTLSIGDIVIDKIDTNIIYVVPVSPEMEPDLLLMMEMEFTNLPMVETHGQISD